MDFAEEYRNFIRIREIVVPSGQLVPYDWIICLDTWHVSYMAYSQMLNEHACELANCINELRRLTLSLDAWDKLLYSKCDDYQRLELVIEFIDPIATVAINLPYVIRSRFIYSIAHLCHQANQTRNREWKDDFPLDSEIYFAQADKDRKSTRLNSSH